eukprot:g68704.t1
MAYLFNCLLCYAFRLDYLQKEISFEERIVELSGNLAAPPRKERQNLRLVPCFMVAFPKCVYDEACRPLYPEQYQRNTNKKPATCWSSDYRRLVSSKQSEVCSIIKK